MPFLSGGISFARDPGVRVPGIDQRQGGDVLYRDHWFGHDAGTTAALADVRQQQRRARRYRPGGNGTTTSAVD